MIKKLKLKNWKCHLDSTLEFSFGTNALLGVMGAGKSSVLDAISFALFGTFPALHQRKVKLEDVIMKKPVRKDFAEVELEFEFNGNVYKVKRRIEKRKATQAELRINGKLVEAQPQRVNEFIEDILKMDFDLFTRAIYSEQNRIDAFLNLPKGQRIKKIDEILKLEKFEHARASAVSLINRFKALNSEFTRFISTLRREIGEEDLKTLKKEIQKIENELNELEEKGKNTKEKFEEKEKERKHLLELRRKKETLEKNLHGLLSQISVLEKQLGERLLPSLEEIKKRVLDIDEKLKKVENLNSEVENKLKSLRKEMGEIELRLREITEAKKKIEKLRKEKWEVQEKIKRATENKEKFEIFKVLLEEKRKEYFSLLAQTKELEKYLHELLKARDTCPVCDSRLTEEVKKSLIEKKKKDLDYFKNKMIKIQKETKELEEKIKELEKKYLELNALQERIRTIENELKLLEQKVIEESELNKKFSEIVRVVEELERKKEELNNQLHDLKVNLEKEKMIQKEVIEFEKKKKELEEKKAYAKIMKRELDETRKIFSEEKLEKLTEESKELYGRFNIIQTKITELQKLKEEKIKRMIDAERKLNDLKKYEEEKRKVERIISDLEKLKEALLRTQEELRKNFIAAINQAMQTIWEELYPYGDFQSIRLSIQEGDYVLQLQELDGTWISAEHVSGGERTLAALTLRIAFALVLAPQLRWLILDEPTHNLDIKAREELARVLRERITEFIDQIFLITHDPILEDAVSGMLYRIEREKEKNGIARVVKVDER